MDSRRVTALVSLGLIAAVIVGIVATSDDDDSSASATVTSAVAAEPAVASDDASPAPNPTPSNPPTGDGTETTENADATTTTEAPTPPPLDPDTPELPNRGPHPEFLEVQEWIQTDATSFDDFDGKVLAVQFWTFGCSNCQATFSHMRDLYAKYGGDDFEIVGVHAPEFDFERDVDAVAAAAAENELTWPIAIDNDKLNFRSWQERRFWPRIFLIDADGDVRYDHIGEGAYDEIDAAVGALIAESTA